MKRRQFLKYGSAAIATVGTFSFVAPNARGQRRPTQRFSLAAVEIFEELIDGEVVMSLAYKDLESGKIRPVLKVQEGETVEIFLENRTRLPVGFQLSGVERATIRTIRPDQTDHVTFDAPTGGTFIYSDPHEAPVHRVLGLHGVMVSVPRTPDTALGVPTPYSRHEQSLKLQKFFEALGNSVALPGAWDPHDPERQKIWVFNTIDSRFNRRLEAGTQIRREEFMSTFTPDYFTLNGLSGYDAAHDYNTVPKGYLGQPCLIRNVNVGMATHGPHIHGNHVFCLSESGGNAPSQPSDNIVELDTWLMSPMDRKDLLLPFCKPPDIPENAWPPRQEPFPFKYPMHCHIEMSQTAAGGNYPQGLVTDWQMLGPHIPNDL
ncbi:MAG: hypothetical protein ACON4C_09040 [Henriciella sp.]